MTINGKVITDTQLIKFRQSVLAKQAQEKQAYRDAHASLYEAVETFVDYINEEIDPECDNCNSIFNFLGILQDFKQVFPRQANRILISLINKQDVQKVMDEYTFQ